MRALVRARHEGINRLFKEFRALRERFRHPLEKHYLVAHSIFRVVQLKLRLGEFKPYTITTDFTYIKYI